MRSFELLQNYEVARAHGDIDSLISHAKRAQRSGDAQEQDALHTLLSALLHVSASERSYDEAVQMLRDLFDARGAVSEALSLGWYSGAVVAQGRLMSQAPPVDQARSLALLARADSDPGYLRQAAELMEVEGYWVRSAIAYEEIQDWRAAARLWLKLSTHLDARGSAPYAAGLARFNVARAELKLDDRTRAHEAAVDAVQRLEEAADRYESVGQRERAFDCYHVLIAIGELTSTFEHVLEGAVNVIRILSEDNLKHHALSSYRRYIDLAEAGGELTAAATLAREMSAYARQQSQHDTAQRAVMDQARLWRQAADQLLEQEAPHQLVENSLVAALVSFAEVEQYATVKQLYGRLCSLDLSPERKAHYARAARRYEGVSDSPMRLGLDPTDGAPAAGPPDVWHVDLLEWEHRGSAAEALADILLDPEMAGDPMTRRMALFARLVALAAEDAPERTRVQAECTLCNYLAPVKLYALLAALERLYQSPNAKVRRASVRALSRYFYKRTFVTLEQALADSDAGVVSEAADALQGLRFAHAFDPLARIYHGARAESVRHAALTALAHVDVPEAAELLLGVLEYGPKSDRQLAVAQLKESRTTQFAELARRRLPGASPDLKRTLDQIFSN